MTRPRPLASRTTPPKARRLRPPLADAQATPDPWSLETLVAEVAARVEEHAPLRPGEPPSARLYQVLEGWVADRDATWHAHRQAEGLAVIREPACKVGCNHCCYQHVAITTVEAELLATSVHQGWTPEAIEALRTRLDRDAEALHAMGSEAPTPEAFRAAIARVRRPCPMLDESSGLCLAYEARPVNCRRENSVDAEVCRRYRLDPDSTESSLRLIRYDLLWGAVHVFLARWSAEHIEPAEDDADPSRPLTLALARHFL